MRRSYRTACERERLHNAVDAVYKSKDRPSGKYGGLSFVLIIFKINSTSLFDALRLLLRLPFLLLAILLKLFQTLEYTASSCLKPHLLFYRHRLNWFISPTLSYRLQEHLIVLSWY